MSIYKQFKQGFSLTDDEQKLLQREWEAEQMGYNRTGVTKMLIREGKYPPDFFGKIRRGFKNALSK